MNKEQAEAIARAENEEKIQVLKERAKQLLEEAQALEARAMRLEEALSVLQQ